MIGEIKSPDLVRQQVLEVREWIGRRFDAGWSDEEIARILPVAVGVITGQTTEAEILRRMGGGRSPGFQARSLRPLV